MRRRRRCISFVCESRVALVMKSFGILLAIAALVACGEARANGQTTPQPNVWENLLAQAQDNIATFGKQIQDNLNLPDQKTVVETFKNQSDAFASNIQNYINQVTQEIKTKSPEIQNTFNDFKAKLDNLKKDLTAQMPDATAQVQDLQKKFNQGVQTLIKETDNVAKTFSQNSGQIQQDINAFTKKAVDIAVSATKQVNEQLQQQAVPKAA